MHLSGNGWERKRITLSNLQSLSYIDVGPKKDTVIFLHGYADSWYSFEPLLRALPFTCRCLAVDLRGHGDSSKPDRRYRMQDFVDDLLGFQEALHIQKSTLVGHSMGSFIAQIFAATYPERVEDLILISSSWKAKGNQALIEACDAIMNLRDPIEESFIAEFQTPSLPVASGFLQTIIAESRKIPSRVWKTVCKELLTVDNSGILDRIQARTLVLWGSRDAIFKKEDQLVLLAGIGRSRLLEYDAGHALHWEIPELIVRDIARYTNRS